MTVVLDYNVIVMCLSSRSPYHIIYQSLVKQKFQIAVNTEIVLEYEEIIQKKYGVSTANAFITLLDELSNVLHINPNYKWQLIEDDPDDNKYSDCAIASKAAYLVTEDYHFNILQRIPFPKIITISIDEFLKIVQAL